MSIENRLGSWWLNSTARSKAHRPSSSVGSAASSSATPCSANSQLVACLLLGMTYESGRAVKRALRKLEKVIMPEQP